MSDGTLVGPLVGSNVEIRFIGLGEGTSVGCGAAEDWASKTGLSVKAGSCTTGEFVAMVGRKLGFVSRFPKSKSDGEVDGGISGAAASMGFPLEYRTGGLDGILVIISSPTVDSGEEERSVGGRLSMLGVGSPEAWNHDGAVVGTGVGSGTGLLLDCNLRKSDESTTSSSSKGD